MRLAKWRLKAKGAFFESWRVSSASTILSAFPGLIPSRAATASRQSLVSSSRLRRAKVGESEAKLTSSEFGLNLAAHFFRRLAAQANSTRLALAAVVHNHVPRAISLLDLDRHLRG